MLSPEGSSAAALYLAAINGVTFLFCFYDKLASKTDGRKRRVPERRFFLLSAFGGAAGMLFGMLLFRHKTRHTSFRVGIPLLCLLWLALCLVVAGRFVAV